MKKSSIVMWIVAILLIVIPFSSCCATSTKEKEDRHRTAILQLESYLESSEKNNKKELLAIRVAFDELERYENSHFFKYYVNVLIKIEDDEYDSKLELYLDMVDNPTFNEYLASELKDSPIRPVEELKLYALGREYQFEGEKALAAEQYRECLSFYDAAERYEELRGHEMDSAYDQAVELLENEKLVEAYALFSTISKHKDSEEYMAYIEKKLGGVPSAEPTPEPAPLRIVRQPKSVTVTNKNDTADATVEAEGDGLTYQWYIKNPKEEKFTASSITDATYSVHMTAAKSGRQAYCIVTDQYGNSEQSDTITLFLIEPTAAPTAEPAHEHSWVPADCTHPKTCSACGATDGKALGHTWKDATCTAPKTCSVCGATDGKALGHTWKDATCTAPKTCSRCGATDGKALGHKWQDATCTTPKTCSVCGATDGKAMGHYWKDATCTKPATCQRCSLTNGKALGHDWKPATKDAPKTCSRCGKTEGSKLTAVKEYRYRDTTTSYSDWSSWGDWTSTRQTISDSNLMQEESRLRYGWWAAQCTNCGLNNPYHGSESKCHKCGKVLSNNKGLWVSVFAYSDDTSGTQTIYGRSGGRYFNGAPYWRSTSNDKTQYRYRTRKVVTQTGSWSSWSTNAPASKTGREIETRTVYK